MISVREALKHPRNHGEDDTFSVYLHPFSRRGFLHLWFRVFIFFCAVGKEEGQRSQGGECHLGADSEGRGTCVRRRTHLRFFQRHLCGKTLGFLSCVTMNKNRLFLAQCANLVVQDPFLDCCGWIDGKVLLVYDPF